LDKQEEKIDKQQAMLKQLNTEIDELKKSRVGDSEVLAHWQTASLVICGVLSHITHTLLA
jgi:hypothetical protein